MALSEERVLEALRTVMDPELGKDLVSLGMVGEIRLEGGRVDLLIQLTTPACPLKGQIEAEIRRALAPLGLEEVRVRFGGGVRPPEQYPLPGVKHVVAVASGKGGVGKSTVAANLALALAREGAAVGLLDADLYGPSQAKMFGLEGERLKVDPQRRILPLEAYGLKVLSIANIVPPGQAMIWRGPILHGTLKQFLEEVNWGELDYLVVDLPPGTGDVQLSLTQLTRVSGGVIVTTPQEVALIDAERAADMFKKVQVPILGVVENMSHFLCPHCGQPTPIFGQGGGRRLAERLKTRFLGEIPLTLAVRESGDQGRPILVAAPESPEAEAFQKAARELAGALSVQSFIALPMA
ncbi:ATP-binding protein, Mrp/Nbp35 [Thermus sp. CCB_US3_UF1]|uniref:Mrp/NBP35 family ATP-binding protein n=1 Tax=unclassified Thermus TaxID=2619321 RepID=UPI0002389CB0|nr:MULTISPECIES: Mrp/NBP35 family ATP-binding protein [unclassified Thermus]AEV16028.1 ATP-binding protein, Mrp/Nbp35 [Thermus sp. CCB_US3_UF1]MCS6867871.1 Mrp/NBP35 family ATP-binding protein [Thermus sp.]MDW8017763.1 Mrp/NBP35 family ATP-binding protein [Thermus sp.]MDW8357677.1 Mrp/NBP35 family ATP-binding protein [Thermus sp.]